MSFDEVVLKQIGSKKIYIQKSHKLPEYRKLYPFYDRALPRICQQIKDIDKKLIFIDVGANIGDSVALITEKVTGSFLCIEGDKNFLPLLKKNSIKFRDSVIEIEPNYCGDVRNNTFIPIRHDGTAKLTESHDRNKRMLNFKTLDQIIDGHPKFKSPNILKIDTDGFEINVINGSKKLLQNIKPIIYFEFTPELYKNLDHDPLDILSNLYKSGYTSALFYDNFGRPIKIINLSDLESINELINKIDNETIVYYDILTFHKTKNQYNQLFTQELFEHSSEAWSTINKLNLQLKEEKQKIQQYNELLQLAKQNVEIANSQAQLSKIKLNEIYSSDIWRLLMIYQVFCNRVIEATNLFKNHFNRLLSVGKTKNDLILPIIHRKINFNSNKIVYIGHSYHNKTKSTDFLLNYLRKYFDVTEILDDSWQGRPFPDLSFIDESYLGIIFFQNLPDPKIVSSINNTNLIFFPMFDSHGQLPSWYWQRYPSLKIINFSETLHKKFTLLGFESMYIKFFPKPLPFFKSKIHKVFFWQRINKININVVEKLIGKFKTKIHIHKSVDPEQTFINLTKPQEERYQVTYSNWFETRKKVQEKIQECDIYIAPREYEGIGLSFLEAMAMGKAVVAVNNPTMNEYITDAKTGYLYDIMKPQPIDFSHIKQIQRNTHIYMKNGYINWIKHKYDIIKFIKKP